MWQPRLLHMEYLEILFENIEERENEILVALLAAIGFDGFEEEAKSLKAFIPNFKFNEIEFNKVIKINHFKYSKSIINNFK